LLEEIKQLTEFIEDSDLPDVIKKGLLSGLALQVHGQPQSDYLKLVIALSAGKGSDEN
jgi:hypothetical protein